MKRKLAILGVCILTSSCQFFKSESEGTPIARVNDSYLYQVDIKGLVAEGASAKDSTILVNNFINRWATQQLLVDGALRNLSLDKQNEFEKLVQQYKTDLYTKGYLEALVNKNLKTTVTDEEALAYYDQNKEAFKLNEELVKLRYISLDINRKDVDKIAERLKRFDNDDKRILDSMAIQFKSFSLKDSVWVGVNQVVDKVPAITIDNKNDLLKKSNFIRHKDSLGVYLMNINDVLNRNEQAPLEYVRPTIDQIVINKRKLELIRDFEKDITKDAIKNKQFEIYK